jgi:mono/diheme cytochrome c family protein
MCPSGRALHHRPAGRQLVGFLLAVLALATPGREAAPAAPQDAARGKSVYETRCAACHGTEGGGDGPAAAAITPKPRNFRDPEFWRGRTAAQLKLVVKQGRPGTLMAPFEGILSDAEIDDVVAYIQSFRPRGS